MADPGRRQQDRPGPAPSRPGPAPAGAVPARGPGAPPPGWVPGQPRGPRYPNPNQPPGPQYYNPGQPRAIPPGVARGPGPGQVPGQIPYGAPGPGPRPGPPAQAGGPQRPRPPAGPAVRPGVYPPQGPPALEPPPARARRGRKVVVRDIHSRRIVRKLDVWSVFKVSFIFYFCVLVVMVAAGAGIWNVAAAFGVVNSIDKSVRSLFALKSYRLHPMTALVWGSAIGTALCVLGVVVNMLAAVFYNLISDMVGGIQVVSVSARGRRSSSGLLDEEMAAAGPPTRGQQPAGPPNGAARPAGPPTAAARMPGPPNTGGRPGAPPTVGMRPPGPPPGVRTTTAPPAGGAGTSV